MEDQHVATILQAISNSRQESTEAIGALAKEFAEFKGTINTKIEAHESYITNEKKWGNIKKVANILAVPLYGVAHAIAAHFGVRV